MATIANSALSLVIDPITRDLIDSADGWFVEATDSRTIVLWQLESTFQAWWGDSTSGSRARAIMRGTDERGGDAQDLADEALRALQALVDEGIISELQVRTDVDEKGRTVILLTYRDRTSGKPVDLDFVPFGG